MAKQEDEEENFFLRFLQKFSCLLIPIQPWPTQFLDDEEEISRSETPVTSPLSVSQESEFTDVKESSFEKKLEADTSQTVSETKNFTAVDLVDYSVPILKPKDSKTKDGTKKKNALQRVFDVIKGFKLGGDLLSLELPPQLLMPKSELQLSGESLYSTREDLLSACLCGKTPLARMTDVVRWYLTTIREAAFLSPYSPMLGETHHVTRGDISFQIEQVAHNPPTTAVYATNEKQTLRLTEQHATVTHFYGTWMEAEMHGHTCLYLNEFGEAYTSTFPRLSIRFLPLPMTSWFGKVSIKCKQSGYEAVLEFKNKPPISQKDNKNKVVGCILDSRSKKVLIELKGRFDENVEMKDMQTGKTSIFYDYRNALDDQPLPCISKSEVLAPTESALVWEALSSAIVDERWEDASRAQSIVEGEKRRVAKERSSKGVKFVPKYFIPTENGGWIWKGDKKVTRAPIVLVATE